MRLRRSYSAQLDWLLTTAKRVSRILQRNRHGPGILLAEPTSVCDGEARVVSLGQLTQFVSTRLELWLGLDAMDSLEFSFWVATPKQHLRTVAAAGDRYFAAHQAIPSQRGEVPLFHVPVADRRWPEASYYGVRLPFILRDDARRAPALLVTDIAYFFYRVECGLRACSQEDELLRYRARVPGHRKGRLLCAPGKNRVFSEYECPQCRHTLKSYEEICDSCSWGIVGALSGTGAESLYTFEVADT